MNESFMNLNKIYEYKEKYYTKDFEVFSLFCREYLQKYVPLISYRIVETKIKRNNKETKFSLDPF